MDEAVNPIMREELLGRYLQFYTVFSEKDENDFVDVEILANVSLYLMEKEILDEDSLPELYGPKTNPHKLFVFGPGISPYPFIIDLTNLISVFFLVWCIENELFHLHDFIVLADSEVFEKKIPDLSVIRDHFQTGIIPDMIPFPRKKKDSVIMRFTESDNVTLIWNKESFELTSPEVDIFFETLLTAKENLMNAGETLSKLKKE